MLAATKTRDFPAFVLDDNSSKDLPPMEAEDNSWKLELNLSQLIIVWAVVAGVMVGVFLLGFYSGREKGLKLSLEKNALDSVRLPVIEPEAKETQSAGFSIEFTPKSEAPKQELISPEALQKAENPIMDPAIIPSKDISQRAASLANTKIQETSKLNAGIYVQLTATRTREDALSIISKLKDKNYTNIILEKAEISKKTYYRIVLGPYSDKTTAELVNGEITSLKVVQSEPYIKTVK